MAKHAAPKRKKSYEDDEFAKVVGRFITAMERRASVNPDALAYMLTLQDEMRGAIDRAGYRLNVEAGFSFTDLARFLTFEGHPMTKQNCVKRWGPTAMAKKLGLVSITQKLNERRERVREAAAQVWEADELAARRAKREAV